MKNKNKTSLQSKVSPRALKAGAAAEYIGCSRRTLTDLSSQGRIPYAKIGPRLLVYDIADLDAFLDECRVEA